MHALGERIDNNYDMLLFVTVIGQEAFRSVFASMNPINRRQGWLSLLCAFVAAEKNGVADSLIVFAVFGRAIRTRNGEKFHRLHHFCAAIRLI